MTLTLLPFNLTGNIYRSPMPYSSYDSGEEVYPAYQEAGIQVVVVLAEREECLDNAGRDLLKLYERDGLRVIHAPVRDFGTPDPGIIEPAVQEVIRAAQSGKHVAVHCHAGIGRTGTFLACLACDVFGWEGDQAVAWVRQYVPGAVETSAQQTWVREYAARNDSVDSHPG